MALVNYMGDAPGFMSYRRQPSKDMTGIPQRQAPTQKEFKQEDLGDLKVKGNPGDRQFVYNQQKEFNNGLEQLYNQYGGEMDWVTADPKYKELVEANQFAVYSMDAAEQNEITTKDREKALNDKNSGHHATDIELVQDQDGSYVPKQGTIKDGKFMTKKDYVQYLIEEPQVKQMPDGSFGVGYVDIDNGIGSETDFNAFLDNIFVDGKVGLTRGASTVSTTQNQQITEGLDYAVNFFKKQGSDVATNYQQLEDGVNYLVKYGMNDQQEYFLWQSFYKDAAQGQEFKMPKVDENGEIVLDKNRQMVTEKVYATDEDLADPAKRKVMFNLYAQDRILDYSQKFKTKNEQYERQTRQGYRNFDPNTGQPIVDQTLPWWANVQSGQGPAGKGFVKDEDYPTSAAEQYNGQLSANPQKFTGKPVVYNKSNISETHFNQAAKSVEGNTIGDLSSDGYIFVGKHRQPAGALKNMTVSDLQDIRQVPTGRMVKDPASGKMVPETTWAARVMVVADDDSDVFDKINYWEAGSGKIAPIATENWLGVDYNDAVADGRKFIFEESRKDAELRRHVVNGDEGTGYFDAGDSYVKGIVVDIPIDGYVMAGWDQKELGVTHAIGSEKIQVNASQKGAAQAHQNMQTKNYGQTTGAVFQPWK